VYRGGPGASPHPELMVVLLLLLLMTVGVRVAERWLLLSGQSQAQREEHQRSDAECQGDDQHVTDQHQQSDHDLQNLFRARLKLPGERES